MTVVITLPQLFEGEEGRICSFLENGTADLVHIRKPDLPLADTERLVRRILDEANRRGMDISDKLVLHSHFSLASKYRLYGIHLGMRSPLPPFSWQGSVSRSCHSVYEVVEWKKVCDYVSLSPVFDSISKVGYRHAFTDSELLEAKARGVIDSKVLALGGVTFNKIPLVMRMGFGGGMILGDAWRVQSAATDVN